VNRNHSTKDLAETEDFCFVRVSIQGMTFQTDYTMLHAELRKNLCVLSGKYGQKKHILKALLVAVVNNLSRAHTHARTHTHTQSLYGTLSH
jgi:hypothetical protein